MEGAQEPSLTRPSLRGVLETVLYYTSDDEAAMLAFYEQVLGLRPVGMGGRAFRVTTAQVVLLFDAARSASQDDPPPHGAHGKVHACFLVDEANYGRWKQRLRDHRVEITRELEWKGGRRSFYFEDPARNVLEIADGDLWLD
ncbi:MAG TPA: VOC family protein [Actinomycetota bacterium]|jgi:catechol 2,3-dioxygenase-like lactoylglutathione lyase family enzyme|nr:VOC family protein [Actinomycetota bacterium]